MLGISLISIIWTLLDLQPYISFDYVWISTYCLQKYNLQKVTSIIMRRSRL